MDFSDGRASHTEVEINSSIRVEVRCGQITNQRLQLGILRFVGEIEKIAAKVVGVFKIPSGATKIGEAQSKIRARLGVPRSKTNTATPFGAGRVSRRINHQANASCGVLYHTGNVTRSGNS